MEIRKLAPEENVYYEAICQKVFFDEPRVGMREKLKNPAAHANGEDLVWGAFDGKGKLLAGIYVPPVVMRVNGRHCKTGVIGGVATLPEARGQKCVARLMQAAFREMRECGQVFSFVYPFSFPYYRQFGFEMCYAPQRVEIDMEAFRGYPYPAGLESVDEVTDAQPFKEVYEQFARGYNLSVVRCDYEWDALLDRDPYDDLAFTFLHRSEAGVPDAYVLYGRGKDDDEGDALIIKELAWTTPEGLHAMFGLFGKLGAEFSRVVWNAPTDLLVHALFPAPDEVLAKFDPAGMNRIIDVPAALGTLQAPSGSGWVTLSIRDAFLPENDGLYCVEWADGKLRVRNDAPSDAAAHAASALANVVDAVNAPDLATDIETLAQLIIGYAGVRDVVYKKGTAVRSGSLTRLDVLFPRRALYMTERY